MASSEHRGDGAGAEPLVGVDQLIGIYDADGGLLGELRYAFGRVFSGGHCALCDLTHRGVRRRAEWATVVDHLGVPVVLLHRNEMDSPLRRVVGSRLPTIVVARDAELEILLGPEELGECGADPCDLERRIRLALAGR